MNYKLKTFFINKTLIKKLQEISKKSHIPQQLIISIAVENYLQNKNLANDFPERGNYSVRIEENVYNKMMERKDSIILGSPSRQINASGVLEKAIEQTINDNIGAFINE